jgi:mannose-6-phosphate isomerase class I
VSALVARSSATRRSARPFQRFPLLLKFLDARDMLSVQVHPSDLQTDYLPAGEVSSLLEIALPEAI